MPPAPPIAKQLLAVDSHVGVGTTFELTLPSEAVAAVDEMEEQAEAEADLSNLSILDLSALGVNGLVDVLISQVGVDTHIKSNEGLNFEIILTGVAAVDLANENFKFAA